MVLLPYDFCVLVVLVFWFWYLVVPRFCCSFAMCLCFGDLFCLGDELAASWFVAV